MTTVIAIIFFAFLLNLPFGYIRSRSKKYSLKWFLSIHMPVPLIVIVRLLFHVDYRYIPLFILASVSGQILGGRLIN